jgi:hypothetical protein
VRRQPQRRLDRQPGAQQAGPRSRLHTLRQEYVEEAEDIRPALQRAWKKVEEGMVGFVNVKTDYRARAMTVRFSSRETSARCRVTEAAPPGSPFCLMPVERWWV